MNSIHISKRGIAVIATAALAAVVLVACGGGDADRDAAVQETERAQAQGLLDKLPVSWAPSSITFNANPGSRQDIPVTLTTKVALKNARVVFVPDLRNAVTVTPETIPALAAGQSATVKLTFAPAATDTRKFIAGIVLLFDQNATTSKPLLVKVTLVKAEVVNGVVVPPEPPADLNNGTLAGFDTNGNGVRDDIDRILAKKYGAEPAKYQEAFVFAASEQALVVSQSTTSVDAYTNMTSCAVKRDIVSVDELDDLTHTHLNTRDRKNAYGITLAGTVSGGCK